MFPFRAPCGASASLRPAGRGGLVARFVLPAMVGLGVLAAACSSSAKSAQLPPANPPVPPSALTTAQPPTPRPGELAVATPSGPAVTIDNFSFTPATISVPVGATVTWVNHDDVPHTVTSSTKAFDSSTIDSDKQFSFTFTTAGTYNYFCSIHPFMTAKVIVQ
ncbi:MAG TPA: cupredoxin family copper-binding protein [Dehalococcoidia bacterium]|nr:cupredoxin family copper-binding protein [Dehalococcoidia bacterium]